MTAEADVEVRLCPTPNPTREFSSIEEALKAQDFGVEIADTKSAAR